LAGLLLGGAVGDALGLPAEGLSRERLRKFWPGGARHRFVFGRGMFSDDTEHALLTAQALLEAGRDVEKFRHSLAWKLRWWFLALPAGVGLGTARACLRLWLGVPPDRSGVNSAGNGPAMRSAIIGANFADDAARRHEFVRVSTRMTHTDARAETAALAVAEAAAWIVNRQGTGGEFLHCLPRLEGSEEWLRTCHRLAEALAGQETVVEFADSLGLSKGVTGYAYHTVPVALFAWLRHIGDFRQAVGAAIAGGGDTDTVAAITGALAGWATFGRAA
jgi:ADP-ribosylglycohydrolase